MAIQVLISKAYKGAGKGYPPDWTRYDDESKTFRDMKEAKAWIKETYRKTSGQPIFVDSPSGEPVRVGFIVSMKASEYDRDTGKLWHGFEQHWITFQELKAIDLDKLKSSKSKKNLKEVV